MRQALCRDRARLDPQGLDARSLDGAGRSLQALLDASGLALPSIAAHGNLLQQDPQRRAEQLARIQAGIDLAADVAGPAGPPCVVTMAYGRPETYEAQREEIAERCEAGPLRRPQGVTVALEPHVGQAFDLPEKVAWLMERVDSPLPAQLRQQPLRGHGARPGAVRPPADALRRAHHLRTSAG